MSAIGNTSVSSAYDLFSTQQQTSVFGTQTRIREVERTYSSSVEKLGKQGYAFALLAGCAAFASYSKLESLSDEQQVFAKKVVQPVVAECLREIETNQCNLSNEKLQFSIVQKIQTVLNYPEEIKFKSFDDAKVIDALRKVITVGTYTFYKLNPKDEKYYAGIIQIPEKDFLAAAAILEEAGYKKAGDTLGASALVKGNIITVDPRTELPKVYDAVMAGHEEYVRTHGDQVRLVPTSLKTGSPQAGKWDRIFSINMAVEDIDGYRGASKLGKLNFPPHVTVFSHEIQPLAQLQHVTLLDFLKSTSSPAMAKLHECFMKFQAQVSAADKKAASAAAGV